MRLAEMGIQELQKSVDTLIVIPNQNLFRVANERTTFADAFAMADQVLHSGVRSITDLMILPGLINLDFADVRAVMSEMGKAMMGTGEATGDDRALLAAQNAIANPLLDETSLKGAKAVLVNITGGMDMTLLEVDEAANAIAGEVDGDANIIFGAAFDPALDGKIRVSVVATGMDEAVIQQIEPQGQAFGGRSGGLSAAAPRQPEVRIDPVREAASQPAPAPTYEAPAARAPEPKVEAKPEPVIHDAPRNLEPIVDPWVEEYEQGAGRAQPAASSEQGDLYFDRAPQRQQPAPQQPAQRPAARHEEPADEPFYDERDHRRSGWSLFGRKRQQPQQQQSYAPPPSSNRTTQQLRQTQSMQPQPQDPQVGQSEDDDLEIPSFLRRLAN